MNDDAAHERVSAVLSPRDYVRARSSWRAEGLSEDEFVERAVLVAAHESEHRRAQISALVAVVESYLMQHESQLDDLLRMGLETQNLITKGVSPAENTNSDALEGSSGTLEALDDLE